MNSGLNCVFANSNLCYRKVSAFSKSTFRISRFPPKDGALCYTSQGLLLQPAFWSSRTESCRIQISCQRRNGFSVAAKEDERSERSSSSADHESSNNSSEQEEIIALFKRIQASIAKDGLTRTRRRSSKNDKDETTNTSSRNYEGTQSSKSIAGAPVRSRKQRTVRRTAPKTKQEDHSSMQSFKLTRLPSNFEKRSPIPSLSTRGLEAVEVKREQLCNEFGEKELERKKRLEEMKVAELKDIAKSRGIKGYSKLKKSELVELLKGF